MNIRKISALTMIALASVAGLSACNSGSEKMTDDKMTHAPSTDKMMDDKDKMSDGKMTDGKDKMTDGKDKMSDGKMTDDKMTDGKDKMTDGK
ncbi:hypothetical protein ACTOVJ_02660 [Arcanobacterium canis]